MSTQVAAPLSRRADENVQGGDHWAPLINALSNPHSESNPDGTIILGLAENSTLHAEVAEHIKRNFQVDPESHFTYGHGPQGSPFLRQAVADFMNEHFKSLKPTQKDEFVVTAGVSGMIESLTWSLCDEGEGILFPQPLYTGFRNDVPTKSRGKVIPVPHVRDDGSVVLDDIFDAAASVRNLEKALQDSQKNGIKAKAVMITNMTDAGTVRIIHSANATKPPETIRAIAQFCARHQLHYLSDEIYALSVFYNPSYPHATKFHSVLSLDLSDIISPKSIHVLYGAAKDFCANGLRLGSFHTRNSALRQAMISITPFAWESYIVQDMWARMLTDKGWLKSFINKNQQRLATNYRVLTTTLDAHGIPYFAGGNSGLFLWTNFRQYFNRHDEDVATMKKREDEIINACLANGVMITKGSNFMTEDYGWFRITFTPNPGTLEIGLQRIFQALDSVS